ncbi:glycosyltransferase family 4 protein [Acidicapsa ligni]|uniref:glycosyltransferase family 4 protein n=1 Tax=Acidicapsa ligni TaxID=542300 RepID=UPI0021DFB92C|nr:glycosyltransferase family 4 protein [Acidicapsa ligni]
MSTPIHSPADRAADSALRIGYLLSRYPAVSHTFFLKEVLGVRDRGLVVETASINPPDRRIEDLPKVEAREAETTFYVKAGGKLSLVCKLLAIVVQHPAVALRGLRAAFQLGGWDLKGRAFALFYLAEALLVGRWLRRNSLEHLHVHFGGPVATVGMLTAAAWQIPWSVTLHGPDEFFDQDAFYLRQKIESAAFVICISDFCRSQVLRVSPATTDSRLEVVRLGVDCTTLQPRQRTSIPASTSISANGVRIVCTGRMVAAKGHRILLEAVAAMVAAGAELSLVLIGDGPERPSLEAQCRQQGIASYVRFLGAMAHQPTLAEVAQADIFVLASFAEGLPVALMEAMALGVPCVSTTIAAIPELILDGQNGLLAPPANPYALRIALERLASDPDLRHRLGLAARATVEEQYNLSRNLDQLANTWRRRLA